MFVCLATWFGCFFVWCLCGFVVLVLIVFLVGLQFVWVCVVLVGLLQLILFVVILLGV